MQQVIAGKVVRDAELKEVGERKYHKTSFCVSTGKNDPLVTVITWFELADECCNLVKGDRVMCVGKEDSHEYGGRTFHDFTAEFVIKHEPIKYTVKAEDFKDSYDVAPEEIPF